MNSFAQVLFEGVLIEAYKGTRRKLTMKFNSAAGSDGIPCSRLLNCAHDLAPSILILFKQSPLSGVIGPSLKKLLLSLFLSRVIEQSLVTIAHFSNICFY